MTEEEQTRLAIEAEQFLNSFMWQTRKQERQEATLYALSTFRDEPEELQKIAHRWGALQDFEDDLTVYLQNRPLEK